MHPFVSVLLDKGIDKPLEYAVKEPVAVGARVEVPLRGRSVTGTVIETYSEAKTANPLEVQTVTHPEGILTPDLLELARFIAYYYCTPLRKVLSIVLPAGVKSNTAEKHPKIVTKLVSKDELAQMTATLRKKAPAQAEVLEKLLEATNPLALEELCKEHPSRRGAIAALVKKGILAVKDAPALHASLLEAEYFPQKPKILHGEQKQAVDKINSSLEKACFQTHLLFGITGSGKTEVYMQAMEKALQLKKTVLMLVPEIALTHQTFERFQIRFKERMAILHHRLSQGQRNQEWQRMHKGEVQIVIGARSALFAPLPSLGLIIVDEEHESSYKQSDDMPCYHARDLAVMRGKLTSSTVILGSATPSLESFKNALEGKYCLSRLTERPTAFTLPKTVVVDMTSDKEKKNPVFSDLLLTEIKKRLESGEQSILFLNRRGYHTSLFCKKCQKPLQCPHCDTSLTLHKTEDCLLCHLCGYKIRPPRLCPTCNHEEPLKYRGAGTEQVEKALYAIFPTARITRLDADTTKQKGSHEKLLKAFATGKADILIGTQMVAKGLHFPQVTLVGVLNADGPLHIPDFRSSETVFQLLTQVSGRAGRGETPGQVIIQTSLREHPTLQYATSQNYQGFYEEEISARQLLNYPPFTHFVKLLFKGTQERRVQGHAEKIRQFLISKLPATFEILPVTPAGHAKINDQFRFQMVLKAKSLKPFLDLVQTSAFQELLKEKGVTIRIDSDPSSTF